MKRNKILILSISLLTSLSILSSCSTSFKIKGDVYLTGIGSFNTGLNYSYFDDYKLEKDSEINAYKIENAKFYVGDIFNVESTETGIIDISYNLDSEAFIENNVSLDSDGYINVLKTGTYNIYVYKKSIDITLGEGTQSNLEDKKIDEEVIIDFYANGDQHGVLEETTYNDKTLPSMPEYVSFINDQIEKSEGEVILLSNGDLWQGTYESNFNYGALLNQIIEDVGYVSMTLGNHEFDWGQDIIRENKENTSVTYLGANIVDRETGELVDYARPYIIEEKAGLKIGIIGVIGRGQLTSITSTMIEDIDFLSEESIIESYSDKLRVTFGCDVVVTSFHTGTSDCRSTFRNLSKESEVSGKPYIDAAFTSHDHAANYGSSNGINYVNSGNNNQNLSHLQLTYNNGDVSVTTTENLSTSTVYLEYEEDLNTRETIDLYCDETVKEKGNQIAGEIDSTFSETKEVPNMMAKAMFEYVENEGYDIDLAIVNDGRANLYQGEVTYSNLLDAIPFFNKTVIVEVSGIEAATVGKNNFYYSDDTNSIENKTYLDTYTIAIYDYILYHQSTSRVYDNFSYSLQNYGVIGYLDKYPCDILFDYMKELDSLIKAKDYTSSNFTFLG